MRHIFLFASLVVVSGLSMLSAQGPPFQTQAAPIFRSDSRLVRVSVVVQDRNRRPVPDLSAADFEVVENGREQKVALFSIETSASRTAPRTAPNIFSNRVDGPGSTGVTVILYDRLNTRYEHQHQARRHIIQYLKQLRPDDRVGFYVLESDAVRVVHGFTRDASSLLEALERTTARSSTEQIASEESLVRPPVTGDAAEDAEIDQWILDTERMVQGFFMQRRINATIGALEALGQNLAGVRGRKNVIWISSGFPLQFHDGISLQNVGQDVVRATRALNDADIAIYPVDARGLVGAFSTPASARQQQFTTLDGVMSTVETSQVIAEQTGGRAYFNTNDLGGAIKRAAEDTSLTYVLGYYPENVTWDGRFRDIEVKVRRRGVDVRHRKGYFAIQTGTTAASRENAMFDALSSPLDVTGVGVIAEVAPADGRGGVKITVTIAPDGVTLRKSADGWEGAVGIAIAQVLPDNRLFNSLNASIPLRLDGSTRERLLIEGLRITRTLTLRPDAHQIKVGVVDSSTGAIGTVTIPASRARAADNR